MSQLILMLLGVSTLLAVLAAVGNRAARRTTICDARRRLGVPVNMLAPESRRIG